jgi:hypothetical protein
MEVTIEAARPTFTRQTLKRRSGGHAPAELRGPETIAVPIDAPSDGRLRVQRAAVDDGSPLATIALLAPLVQNSLRAPWGKSHAVFFTLRLARHLLPRP